MGKKRITSTRVYAINADAKIIRNMPWSQVACFEISRGFVYLKCTAEVFFNELRLLGFLLKHGISHLPLLIATNQEQRCFLFRSSAEHSLTQKDNKTGFSLIFLDSN